MSLVVSLAFTCWKTLWSLLVNIQQGRRGLCELCTPSPVVWLPEVAWFVRRFMTCVSCVVGENSKSKSGPDHFWWMVRIKRALVTAYNQTCALQWCLLPFEIILEIWNIIWLAQVSEPVNYAAKEANHWNETYISFWKLAIFHQWHWIICVASNM